MSVPRLEIAKSVVCYSLVVWFCSLPQISGLRSALNSFADACDTARMKISTAKTEVLYVSRRNPDQCSLQVTGATLKQAAKFKYLEVAFTSDERQDKALDTRISKTSVVMLRLHFLVVVKQEFSEKAKLSIFKSFCPILTYGHESRVMTERVGLQMQAFEIRLIGRWKELHYLRRSVALRFENL